MTCKHCHTEIADKALICYRCGRSTSDPRIAPPSTGSLFEGRRRSRWPIVIAVVVVIVVVIVAALLLLGRPADAMTRDALLGFTGSDVAAVQTSLSRSGTPQAAAVGRAVSAGFEIVVEAWSLPGSSSPAPELV